MSNFNSTTSFSSNKSSSQFRNSICSSNMEQKMCRLCLRQILNQNFKVVDSSITCMIKLILPELKLTICENPVICNNCLDTLEQSSKFRKECLDNDFEQDCIEMKMDVTRMLDLGKLLENRGYAYRKNMKICRTCLSSRDERRLYIKISKIRDDPLRSMFEKCFPTMIIDEIKNPVVCNVCLENLEEYFNFIMECLSTEEKINYYCEVNKSIKKVNLHNVYVFSESVDNDDISNTCVGVDQIDDTQMITESVPEIGHNSNSSNPCTEKNSEIEKAEIKNYKNKHKTNDVVTFQITKSNNGEEIITETLEDSDDEMDSDLYTPMSQVLNVKYSKDPNQDEVHTEEFVDDKRDDDMLVDVPDYAESTGEDTDDSDYGSKSGRFRTCKLCDFRTKSAILFTTHRATHKVVFKCDFRMGKKRCNFISVDNEKYQKHREECHVGKLAALNTPVTTVTKANLSKHMNSHKPVLQTSKTNTQTLLKTFNLKMHKCQFCPYQTRRRANLARHNMSVHYKVSVIHRYKCKKCPFETIQKENFYSHIQSHKSESQTKKCFLCSFQPKSDEDLKKHVDLVHKNRQT